MQALARVGVLCTVLKVGSELIVVTHPFVILKDDQEYWGDELKLRQIESTKKHKEVLKSQSMTKIKSWTRTLQNDGREVVGITHETDVH